jgi:thiol-disulfide isomerase/thioredoxin
MKKNTLLLGAALVACSAFSLSAAKIGDPAAPLVIKEWVKGSPVDVRDGKHVYVVEFWATWCPPCRASIPHLTEVQKKFKDKGVVVVGVSDEPVAKVKPFVEQMGAKMDYHVACDDSRKTSAGYMRAYDQNGIPTAFIIGKDGKVLWFGHPMGGLEEKLAEVLAGKYDLKAAIKADEFRAAMGDYKALVAKGDPAAKAAGEKLLKLAGTNVDTLSNMAFEIVASPGGDQRDFTLAGKALDKAVEANGKTNARLTGIRAVLLFESGDKQGGVAMAKKAITLSETPREKQLYNRYVEIMERQIQKQKQPAPKSEQ